MPLLERLRQIKIKLWIVIGVLLGILITMIAALVLAASLLSWRDARKAAPVVKNQLGMEFISIAPGSFMMGSDNGRNDEKPAHQVTVTKGFLIGRYEVTAGQWKAVMGKEATNYKRDYLPVQFVSWNDAQEFIRRLNQRNDGYSYRLPTEAEWEYACRAGTNGDYPDNLEWLAFYEANSGHRPHEVGEKHPNAWGVYDMNGNMEEWCQDWYDKDYYAHSPGVDPQGPATGTERVIRGGSFIDSGPFSAVVDGSKLRSPARSQSIPAGILDSYGFRIVAVKRP